MIDKFITWISQYPKLHVFFLTWMFLGLTFAWLIMVLPVIIYGAFREDFDPYFADLDRIWNKKIVKTEEKLIKVKETLDKSAEK